MKLATVWFSFAVTLTGCPTENGSSDAVDTGETPAEDTEPRSYTGTLSIAVTDYVTDEPVGRCEGTFALEGPAEGPWCGDGTATCADEPVGRCEGTFALEGPAEGPWCGDGTATCADGLADSLGAEATYRVCFDPYEQGWRQETMTLNFQEVTDCVAQISSDVTCAYDWEVSMTPERLYAEITGSGFCRFEYAQVEVLAERVHE